MKCRIALLLLVMQIPLPLSAQEKPLNLGGAFHMGYSNSRLGSRFGRVPQLESRAAQLTWGLDLDARTYILDPRFIALSYQPTIQRTTGNTNGSEIGQASTGNNFYLDFLRTSFYPFRFYVINQSNSDEQMLIDSRDAVRRSLGFNWALRKPKLPRLSVQYDSSTFDREFGGTLTSQGRSKTFGLGTQHTYRGWQTNFSYNKAAATDVFTGLESATDSVRGDGWKQISSRSRLSVATLYQELEFLAQPTAPRQELAFFNVRANLNTMHTEKLSSTLFYQHYRSGGLGAGETGPTAAAPGPDEEIFQPRSRTSFFNSAGIQITYRLLPAISVGQSLEGTLLNAFSPRVESATRLVNTASSINWNKKVKFLQTRAAFQGGLSQAQTNLKNSRTIPFHSYSAGLGAGDRRYLLIRSDLSASRRPDIFNIGGWSSRRALNTTAETHALRPFALRASVGRDELELLTPRGRERLHTMTYSADLNHRIFAIQVARNASDGLQNLLLSSPSVDLNQLFRTLPVEEILGAPYFTTLSVFTTASLTVKLRNGFDARFQYIRQSFLQGDSFNLGVNRYELLVNYRLGKFIFTGGSLFSVEETRNLTERRQTSFFFRFSRKFVIF